MDNINRFIIRYLKEKKVYTTLLNDKYYRDKFVDSFIHTINPYQFLKSIAMQGIVDSSCFHEFTHIFDYDLYNRHFFLYRNNISIINVKDYCRFKNFLNKNGIIWCNDRAFDDEDIKRYTNNDSDNYYFMFDIHNSCKLYHGRYEPNDISTIYDYNHRIILTEEEFYDYYNKLRKKINDNILSYLKQDIFNIN